MRSLPDGVPSLPGVYRFLDKSGDVLYVGKAKSLKSRLSQYFPPDPDSLHPRTREMVSRASQVSFTVVSSESEALLSEASLIKSLQPPFNIRLRDDHSYPSVVISDHVLPRVFISRQQDTPGERFGPFPTPSHARALLDAVSLTCAVRPCRDGTLRHYQRLGRPCVLGSTGVCAAPCVSADGYSERVSMARSVLSGRIKEVSVVLKERMSDLSKERLYESAARTRDAIDALSALRNQGLLDGVSRPTLAVAVASDRLGCFVQMMLVSDGVLVSAPAVLCDTPEFDTSQVAQAVLLANVPLLSPLPTRVVSDVPLSSEVLSALSLKTAPTTGVASGLFALCAKNASLGLKRERSLRLSSRDAVSSELQALKEALDLPSLPLRIECLDISHHHGKETTAAFAVTKEGVPVSKLHRSFNLDTGNNDVLSIKTAVLKRVEVLRKQLSLPINERDVSLSQTPDLLLIDGGSSQLEAARQALEISGVFWPVASLAKHLEEVFLPDRRDPLRLDLSSPALYVLQRSRDAAHDLSLRKSRARRLRSLNKTGLEDIPGLGAKRLRRLLDIYSLAELSLMSIDSMPSFLPMATKEALIEHFAKNPDTQTENPPKKQENI